MGSSSSCWYSELIQWIHNNGGYIHENLVLGLQQQQQQQQQQQEEDQGQGPFAKLSKSSDNYSMNSSSRNDRGIVANEEIPQGTVLIRLPIHLAVSGETFPSIYRITPPTVVQSSSVSPPDNDPTTKRVSVSIAPSGANVVKGEEEEEVEQAGSKEYNGEEEKTASPWLRCVAALMSHYLKGQKSANHDNNCWKFYLNSLPNAYESILLESSWSDQDIDMFLSGTTIGNIAKKDRLSHTLEERFELSVKPYLIANQLIIDKQKQQQQKQPTATNNEEKENDIEEEEDDDDELFTLFQKACACISTRGFHLTGRQHNDGLTNNDNDDEHKEDSHRLDYAGPFLLPFIDLLNHTSNPHEKCTTLQRTTVTKSSSHDGYFTMVAERHVNKGQEILHSYGQNLSSGQLFQTFGFVEESFIRRATAISMDDDDDDATMVIQERLAQHEWTPVILSKQEIVEACQYIASSNIPQELEYKLATIPELCNDCDFDCWDLPSQQCLMIRNKEDVVQQQIPEDIIISNQEPLSCDLVTLCCVQFLPDEAYEEIVLGSEDCGHDSDKKQQKILSMLSPDVILQDYFLGNLVLKTILHAIERKALKYKTMDRFIASMNHDSTTIINNNSNYNFSNDKTEKSHKKSVLWNQLHQDQRLLNHLLQQPQSQQPSHAMYGLTLRIEEMTCLYQLEQQCQQWLTSFQPNPTNNDDADDDLSRPRKQIKHNSCS